MRLYQLFYVTALIAASLNLFGLMGIVAGCLIAGGWYFVFSRVLSKRLPSTLKVVGFSVILHLFTCCILPGVMLPKVASWSHCANNVKAIALAMRSYETVWKKLPPSITYDANGHPMHSWHVLLLPYLGEQRLYDSYSFDEPWDGPNNSRLVRQMPSIYRCSYLQNLPANDFMCGYRVLIGERTCFPPTGSRAFSEILDGLPKTILIVESNQRVPWMSPVDLTPTEYMAEVKGWLPGKSPHRHHDLLTHYDRCGNTAMADGSVHFSFAPINDRLFEKLVIIDDGGLTQDDLDAQETFHSQWIQKSWRARWEGYIAIAAFIFSAGLPAVWFVHDSANKRSARGIGSRKDAEDSP